MSDASTKTMLRPFIEKAPATLFLAGFFQSPPENFYASQTVEIDIQRDGEDVAVPVTDLATGNRYNENSVGSNKEFTPPIFKEAGSISAFQLMTREMGDNPFENRAFQAKATLRAGVLSGKILNKLRRALELQASQVFQTGVLTLVNAAGTAVYQLDFLAKGTHFTTPTAWAADGATGDPYTNIDDMAQLIRKDGRRSADTLILGTTAQNRFLANARIKDLLKYDGFYGATGRPQIVPERNGAEGANFLGNITINNYRYALWGYDGRYNHPQTGTSTPFVADNKVIMLSSKARYDATFGAIPMIGQPEGRVLQFLPPRVSMEGGGGLDFMVNGWLEPDGQTLSVSLSSRPLLVPTEVDSFGCMTVA
jgi:hypothetical protein